ncbi:RibD family protein [Halomonas sp. H10-9-1]|uniref:RibD family protein n=1 Tax=Halomonas sp. H10-9-1 TaxID=2950871 RepID=UPI0032DED1EB
MPAGDFIVDTDAPMFYVSIDARGELAWPLNSFTWGDVKAHVLEVLTEAASNGYKDFLRRRHISYIIAGKKQIDYAVMLDKLYQLGIKRLAIGGGGAINWSFVQQGLVDEVSMVLAPIADGDANQPRFFKAQEPYSQVSPVAFKLLGVEALNDGVVWLRYSVKKQETS